MTKTKSLTIAIPLYNESETIKQLKQKLLETPIILKKQN